MEKLAGKNAALVLDVLGGRLAFERTGVKLYDAAIAKIDRSAEPRYHALLGEFRHIRAEEKEHEEWLEEQIRKLGGSAHETTTMSQLEMEESSGIAGVILDGHQRVLDILHALLAAELSDNAGWDLLVRLADDTGDRMAKAQFMKRLAEEMRHLAFVREAVVRAAEVEILGRDEPLPSRMRDVALGSLRKPIAAGGTLAALLFGAGALAASTVLANTPSLARRTRRMLSVS